MSTSIAVNHNMDFAVEQQFMNFCQDFDFDQDGSENEILFLAGLDQQNETTSSCFPTTTTSQTTQQEQVNYHQYVPVSPEHSDSEETPCPASSATNIVADASRYLSSVTPTDNMYGSHPPQQQQVQLDKLSVPCPLTSSPVLSSTSSSKTTTKTQPSCVSPTTVMSVPNPIATGVVTSSLQTPVLSTITARTFLMPVQEKASPWTKKTLPKKKSSTNSSTIKRRRPIAAAAITPAVVVSSSSCCSSDSESSTTTTTTTTTSSSSEKQLLTAQEIFEKRRERNRRNAQKSRIKKKDLTNQLQQALVALKAENEKIRTGLMAALEAGHGNNNIINMSPEEQMVADLKKPSNRIVDDTTMAFLRNLRNNLPSKSN